MGFSGTGFSSPLRQPKDEWIQINNGASVTYSENVRLRFHCDAAWKMQVANGSDPTGAAWQDYQREIPWTVIPIQGTRRVSVRFRLFDGNYSTVVYDDIDLVPEIPQVGSCGLAMDNLRLLISYCDTFQAWTGSADQSEALGRIKRHWCQPPYIRPYVLISEIPDLTLDLVGVGPQRTYEHTGSLNVLFEANPREYGSPRLINWEQELLVFKRDVCEIVGEMIEKNCQMGPHDKVFICIEMLSEGQPHTIPDQDEIREEYDDPELCLQVVYTFRWR